MTPVNDYLLGLLIALAFLGSPFVVIAALLQLYACKEYLLDFLKRHVRKKDKDHG